jgi:hypothetical protein
MTTTGDGWDIREQLREDIKTKAPEWHGMEDARIALICYEEYLDIWRSRCNGMVEPESHSLLL